MDLDITITRSGEDGKDRRVELSCDNGRGTLYVVLVGNTVSEGMAKHFAWLTDRLMSGANLRTLDHQAFQAWQRAGSAADNTVSASRRWQITQDQLHDLETYVNVVPAAGSSMLSCSFQPHSTGTEEKS